MTTKVGAAERYVADFEVFASNGARGAPAWIKEIRARAIARFAALGFPSTKQEEWRFTSVARIADARFAPGDGEAGSAVTAAEVESLTVAGGPRLAFVNGAYAPGLSSIGELPRGAVVSSLAEAFHSHPELVRPHLTRHAEYETSPFTALNTAFLADGAFV